MGVPRAPSPEIRRALIERAAGLLARREPVTLQSLVDEVGVSTMAVYTYFDGMPGLWGAVRQEGFVRLAEGLASIEPGPDPVGHLAALGVAYVRNAVASPDLYRVMFDASWDLPDPEAAAAAFEPLVIGARRAQDLGRFTGDTDAEAIALRYWADGHGVTSLAVTGVLTIDDLHRHAPAMQVAQFVAAGDTPDRAKQSVAAAWSHQGPAVHAARS